MNGGAVRTGPMPTPLAAAFAWGLALSLTACAPSARQTREARTAPPSRDTAAADAGPSATAAAWVPTDAKVRIRLHNLSDSLLTDLRVFFPGDSERIAFLRPRAYTDYFSLDSAYRYASIQAKSGGKDYFCQPADFTGETPLAPGRYTYELSPVRNRDPDAKVGFFLLELLEDKGHP